MIRKILLTSFIAAISYIATAQEQTVVSGAIHIHEGGNLTFFGDVEVLADGLLHNEAGTLYTRADVRGEERIQMGEEASLDVNGGTFTFKNEQHEKFKDLTIGTSGILEVTPGNSLTITGSFNNLNNSTDDSEAGLNLYADENGYGQLLTTGSVTNKGVIYAQQYLKSATNRGWRHLGSPVLTTLAEIDDDFKTYYENPGANQGERGSSSQWNLWWYDASPDLTLTGPDNPASATSRANAKYYTPANANNEAFGPDNNARGYILYVGGPFAVLNANILDVRGAFGNESYTFNLYKTHDKGPGAYAAAGASAYSGVEDNPTLITGWNLIPNPYPSNLDVSELLDDNTNFGLNYKAVHIWDPLSNQYIVAAKDINSVINWNTGDPTDPNYVGPTGATTLKIAPFQAFWVKANLAGGGGSSTLTDQITLTNNHRTVDVSNNFFKTTPPHIALRLWNADASKKDQTIVAFGSSYDNGLQNDDAIKFLSSDMNAPELSTLAEGIRLSINRLRLPDPGHAIPVQFKSAENGERFSIAVAEYEIDPTWTLHLFDWKTKKLHDLKYEGVYNFTNDTEWKDGNRFTFYINYKEANFDPFNNVKIWGSREGIEVTFANPSIDPAAIEIMDLAGKRLFYSNKVPTNQNFIWPVSFGEPRMYVVRVTTSRKHTIERVLR
jgi:hypothetical protein